MFGAKGRSATNFSLDAIQRFCEKMGDPHQNIQAVHVAGTNGKGTTCRMLASVYQSAGYKTGLYTSPHLEEYRERFAINSEMIPEKKLLEFFQRYGDLAEEIPLSYFELSTAVAFWYFNDQQTDIAIIETGLGGRLDATNILDPLASVITSVGLDHTDILGETLAEIAIEKAGIIKPKRPVLVGKLPADAHREIKRIASEKGSDVILAADNQLNRRGKEDDFKRQEGLFLSEKINLPVVTSVIRCLSEQYPVSCKQADDGIVKWKIRYSAGISFRRLHSQCNWYFDGAHNSEAIELLLKQLKTDAALSDWTLVLSMMGDKINTDIVKQVSAAGCIFLYNIGTDRSATIDQLRKYLPGAFELPINDDKKPSDEWIQKYKSELVIFTGSFYFYNTVKRWMKSIDGS